MPCCQCIRTLLFEKGVKTIVVVELLRQFAHYGVQAMMFLFFMHELHASVHHAVAFVHLAGFLSHISTVIGYLIAGRPISNRVAIWLFAAVEVAGNVLIVVAASAPGLWSEQTLKVMMILLSSLGFAMRAFGGGAIKAALTRFEDQLVSPDRTVRGHYFAFLFYSLGFASSVAILAAPWLRMHSECVGAVYCFPYGFALPVAALGLARLLVLCSCCLNDVDTEKNVIAKTLKCISVARSNAQSGGDHWLDAAEGSEFDEGFIKDVKILLRVLAMFIPLPIFWALFGQMWSRWIYQATEMDGIVNDQITLEPDSMAFLNPVFIVLVMPLLDFLFFPIITRCYLCAAPSHRALLGGIMALLAILAAAHVQTLNEPTLELPLKSTEVNIFFWNPMICWLNVHTDIKSNEFFNIDKLDIHRIRNYAVNADTLDFTVKSINCSEFRVYTDTEYTFQAQAGSTKHILLDAANFRKTDTEPKYDTFYRRPVDTLPYQDFSRSVLQLSKLGMILQVHPNPMISGGNITDNMYPPHQILTIADAKGGHKDTPEMPVQKIEPNAFDFKLKLPGKYTVHVSGANSHIHGEELKNTSSIEIERAGVYVFGFIRKPIVNEEITDETKIMYTKTMTSLTKPPTVSILWQTPQYALISLAQYLWPATILHYAMRQVSASLHPVVVTCYALANALGDLLVAILAICNFFRSDYYNYMLLAFLMGLTLPVLLLFAYLYREYDEPEDQSVGDQLSSGDYSPQQSPEESPEAKRRRSTRNSRSRQLSHGDNSPEKSPEESPESKRRRSTRNSRSRKSNM